MNTPGTQVSGVFPFPWKGVYMLLSDGGIARALSLEGIAITPDPFSDARLTAMQPASVDVCLGDELRVFFEGGEDIVDPERRQEDSIPKRIPEQGFIVEPLEFLLGTTVETVKVGPGYAMQFTGKSSLARLGLLVHATAGHIDPGFEGKITLEIMNLRGKMFRLRAGMPIGQLLVFKLDADAIHPYGDPALRSRYMGQSTVTESRSWM